MVSKHSTTCIGKLYTAGAGLVQHWGGAIQKINQGDIVWVPPGVKHWHGAAPTTGMTHISIAEQLDGKTVTWMEPVSDEQYRMVRNTPADAVAEYAAPEN